MVCSLWLFNRKILLGIMRLCFLGLDLSKDLALFDPIHNSLSSSFDSINAVKYRGLLYKNSFEFAKLSLRHLHFYCFCSAKIG